MKPTVCYSIQRPFAPLPSDRTVLWLASNYAAAGYPVCPADSAGGLDGDCGLLLTNRKLKDTNPGFPAIVIGCDGDLRDRIRLALGVVYGRMPSYHRSGDGALSRLLSPLRRLLNVRRSPAASLPDMPPGGAGSGLAGGRVVIRVNVDWDERGLDILERWCEMLEIRPTLAVAGSEISNNEARFKRFVEQTGCGIASHTWSHHVVLSSSGRSGQQREIIANHDYLEQLTGREVRGFVAPYVKYNRHTFGLLEESGYRWFIRSWLLHPLRLQGTSLTDLGVNFSFSRGWQDRLGERLSHSDLALQLHLRDLVRYEHLLEHNIRLLLQRGVRIIDCETYFRETGGETS